jgi:hypothetical protein
MKMEMVDLLPAVISIVGDKSIPCLIQTNQ